ncbi:hypothetical protein A2U01_0114955, partial [Trifolium medium]|nr:hypothetical protein [Trifolium medium]
MSVESDPIQGSTALETQAENSVNQGVREAFGLEVVLDISDDVQEPALFSQ